MEGGFRLLGRVDGAEAKGCSLAVEEFLLPRRRRAERRRSNIAGYLPGLAAPTRCVADGCASRAGARRVEVALPALTRRRRRGPGRAQVAGEGAEPCSGAMEVARIAAMPSTAPSARLLDRDHPLRRKAEHLLPIVTGYDRETVRLGLTATSKTFRQPQLQRFLAEDFANPGMLDAFQPAPKGGFARAYGPGAAAACLGRQRAGPAALELDLRACWSRPARSARSPRAEPLLAGWFARLLAEIDPRARPNASPSSGGRAATEAAEARLPDAPPTR